MKLIYSSSLLFRHKVAKGKACLSCGSPLIAAASARRMSERGAPDAEATLYFSTAQSSRESNLTFILNSKFVGGKKKSIFVFLLEILSKEKPGHNTHKNIRQLLQKNKNPSEIYFSQFFYSNIGRKSESLSTLFWNKGWCCYKVSLF